MSKEQKAVISQGKTNSVSGDQLGVNGLYGEFGGSYVSPELQRILDHLEEAFLRYRDDPEFLAELDYYNREYVGRPSPLYFAEGLTEHVGGAKI